MVGSYLGFMQTAYTVNTCTSFSIYYRERIVQVERVIAKQMKDCRERIVQVEHVIANQLKDCKEQFTSILKVSGSYSC